jgi:hypothetical protein
MHEYSMPRFILEQKEHSDGRFASIHVLAISIMGF